MGWEYIRNCKRCRGDFEFKGKELLCPDCISVAHTKKIICATEEISREYRYKSPMISKRIKNLRKGHAKYLERKEKAKRLRELNKNKLIAFCSNCKEPFVCKINLQENTVILGGTVQSQLYQHIILGGCRTGRCPKCRGWNYDKNFFNYFKGIMFSKNHELNNFDKALIRTRVRLFEIQRKEVMTDATNRI